MTNSLSSNVNNWIEEAAMSINCHFIVVPILSVFVFTETLGKAWVVFNGCPEGSTNEEADTSFALAAEADVSQGSQTGEVQLNTPIERGCKDSCHDTDKVTQCHGCCCSDSDTDISQGSDTMKELVCYGIGNFATSLIARYQLALFLIFRDELKVRGFVNKKSNNPPEIG